MTVYITQDIYRILVFIVVGQGAGLYLPRKNGQPTLQSPRDPIGRYDQCATQAC